MAYQVTLKQRALKALEDINEPYYSMAVYVTEGRSTNSADGPIVLKSLPGRFRLKGFAFLNALPVMAALPIAVAHSIGL